MKLQVLSGTMLRICLHWFGGFYSQIPWACTELAYLSGRLFSTVRLTSQTGPFRFFQIESAPMKAARKDSLSCYNKIDLAIEIAAIWGHVQRQWDYEEEEEEEEVQLDGGSVSSLRLVKNHVPF